MPSAAAGCRHPRGASRSVLFPTITTWNRLEGRPRSQSFDRALQAEVRDALWMLTKQWQMGEFRGSDAGSPVFAKLLMRHDAADQVPPGRRRDPAVRVRRSARGQGGAPTAATASAEARSCRSTCGWSMGRQWLRSDRRRRRLLSAGLHRRLPDRQRPIRRRAQNADVCAHPEVWETFAGAVAGRAMDGGALYEYLCRPGAPRLRRRRRIAPADHARARRPRAAVPRLVRAAVPAASHRPATTPGYPPQLEYQFAASAPLPGGSEKVYVADEYYQGGSTGTASTSMPASTRSTRSPARRRPACRPTRRSRRSRCRSRSPGCRTRAGGRSRTTRRISATSTPAPPTSPSCCSWSSRSSTPTTGSSIPYTLPAGAIATIRGLAVTNVFGERFWIDAADAGRRHDWRRWSMFTINVADAAAGRRRHQPAAPADRRRRCRQSPPTEEVYAGPRRGREHGVGRRANGPACHRRSQDGHRGGRARR